MEVRISDDSSRDADSCSNNAIFFQKKEMDMR